MDFKIINQTSKKLKPFSAWAAEMKEPVFGSHRDSI